MADEIRFCGGWWTICDGDCTKCAAASTYTTNRTETNDSVKELLWKRGDFGE